MLKQLLLTMISAIYYWIAGDIYEEPQDDITEPNYDDITDWNTNIPPRPPITKDILNKYKEVTVKDTEQSITMSKSDVQALKDDIKREVLQELQAKDINPIGDVTDFKEEILNDVTNGCPEEDVTDTDEQSTMISQGWNKVKTTKSKELCYVTDDITPIKNDDIKDVPADDIPEQSKDDITDVPEDDIKDVTDKTDVLQSNPKYAILNWKRPEAPERTLTHPYFRWLLERRMKLLNTIWTRTINNLPDTIKTYWTIFPHKDTMESTTERYHRDGYFVNGHDDKEAEQLIFQSKDDLMSYLTWNSSKPSKNTSYEKPRFHGGQGQLSYDVFKIDVKPGDVQEKYEGGLGLTKNRYINYNHQYVINGTNHTLIRRYHGQRLWYGQLINKGTDQERRHKVGQSDVRHEYQGSAYYDDENDPRNTSGDTTDVPEDDITDDTIINNRTDYFVEPKNDVQEDATDDNPDDNPPGIKVDPRTLKNQDRLERREGTIYL